MELEQIRCFTFAASELHFGRAAQKCGMLPASFSRHIRLLEESLHTALFERTTRSVSLTAEGALLLEEVGPLLARLDHVAERFRASGRSAPSVLRIGAIDSAAAGLLPFLLQDFREKAPDIVMQLVEEKSIRLIPKLLAGRLDIVFIRPGEGMSREIMTRPLFHETAVVAVSSHSPLAIRAEISIADIRDEPLIVPERRSRPHSHDLTMTLFSELGIRPRIAQIADEKQTIVNLVAAGAGSAIVPRWTSRLAVEGVSFVPLAGQSGKPMEKLPLAVAWMKSVRDPVRDALIDLLYENIERYSALA